jgi:hypothetical protein
MKLLKRNRKMLLVLASLFLLAALPATSLAQGRGRGRGQDKKLDKFVNGHDARDGRWDGRGPDYSRRSLIGNEMRNRRSNTYYTNRYYSYRHSQPYFANRHTYAWANPTYRYDESWYRERHRRRGLRSGIRFR